jgi:uncharacterized protein YfaS (alpha-2-macroglobulin family)
VEAGAAKATAVNAPASLYFDPNLMTDAQGQAKVQFVMPPTNSEYRLLIDALGNGRVGSRQVLLSAGEPPAK